MEAKAKTRFVRIAPRKARLVVDLIRGRGVGDALTVLDFTPKRAAKIVAKTLRSAVANAESRSRLDVDELFVKQAFVDEGPTQKRTLPRAHGRATKIAKRTSHVTVVVGQR